MVKGLDGMQYNKKRFTNYADSSKAAELVETEDHKAFREQVEAEKVRLKAEMPTAKAKKARKIFLPLGDRLIVRKQKVGEKIGSGILVATDHTRERDTDLAEVISLPELTFADKALLENSESIVNAQTEKAKAGDADALATLLRFNQFLKIKALNIGDKVFISKYTGINFHDSDGADFTVVLGEDVISIVKDAA